MEFIFAAIRVICFFNQRSQLLLLYFAKTVNLDETPMEGMKHID